ncbi:hypothetical protein BFJ63_vAg16362 [Fusarium oxysporum f. sp. narcissi]|uniref:DUF3295 domain-containing protein n=1 Tax=Fusarium oxysporum f. sp. narcissi TaxID=451672 RepID=A0A4Q2V9S1_FUSOX|nr:hypothetical protein BFJ63_vAg16362 [Fusarium oxysporum f. sp. narcissi]
MPYRLDTHGLTVDANVIHKVDAGNSAILYSMWTAPARQKVLDWKQWGQKTYVVERTAPTTQTIPPGIHSESMISDPPQLSSSVKSGVDEEAVDLPSVPAPLEITHPLVRRQGSFASTQDKREHYMSPDHFEKTTVPIVKNKGPLSPPPHIASAGPPAFESTDSGIANSNSSLKPIGKLPAGYPKRLKANEFTVRTKAKKYRNKSKAKRSRDKPKLSEDGEPLKGTVNPSRYRPPVSALNRGSIRYDVRTVTIDEGAAVVLYSNDNTDKSVIGDDDFSCYEDGKGEGGSLYERDKKPSPVILDCKRSGAPQAATQLLEQSPAASNGSSKPFAPSKARSTIVIRGFEPSKAFPYETNSGSAQLSAGILRSKSPVVNEVQSRKLASSSSEQDQNLSDSQTITSITNKPMSLIGGSSKEDEPDNVAAVGPDSHNNIDDYAIDDDDDDDGDSNWDGKLCHQVGTHPNLTSRRSLIPGLRNLGDNASQSTSATPRSPSESGSSPGAVADDIKATPDSGLKPIHEVSKSNDQPTMARSPSIKTQDVQSPLLAITWMKIISLLANKWIGIFRRYLIRERQQDSSAADAVLKQPSTPHDADNLNQSLGESVTNNDVHAYDWDQRFLQKIRNNGYHSTGW